jgi:UDP:flavonoid glycosyltransferase YjiC (YdhE family)
MHVLITTVGSSGDHNPFIAVGRALVARGHRVTFLANPHFAAAIEHAGNGLRYEPLGERFDFAELANVPGAMHRLRGGGVVMREFIIPVSQEMHRRCLEIINRDPVDLVFSHHIAFGATWAAEQAGVPFAVATLSPALWLNPLDRPVLGPIGSDHPPVWLVRAQRSLGRRVLRFTVDPSINRVRRAVGLPRGRDFVFTDTSAARANLGLWSPSVRPEMPGDPDRSRVCGFCAFDRLADAEHPAHEVDDFLRELDLRGERAIVFTLGTAVVHAPGRFYHAAADACRRLERPGLLLTNRAQYAPPRRDLPANVRAFTYAPFSTLLPRAAATVHHGGVGTTNEALRAGRPTVVCPVAYDQFDSAARMKRLGTSATVPHHRVTTDRLVAALRSVLESPETVRRAREIGAAVSGENGPDVAAQALEAVAAQRVLSSAQFSSSRH